MQGEPIRVLFVNDHAGYPGGVIHGVTRYFLNVLPRLDPSKVNASLCFLRDRHPAAAELEGRGLRPVFLNRGNGDPRALMGLVRLVRARGVDILHVAGMKGLLLGRIAAGITRRHAIIHLHDTKSIGVIMRFVQRRVARWTDLALGVSDPVSTLAIREFGISPDRVQTLHNGIPVGEFASPSPAARSRIRRELGISETAPVIGITGRLSSEKGHELLIRAMPLLLDRLPAAVLVVAGDGPTRPACQSLVDRFDLAEAVRFAGYRTDIPDVLAAVDVMAMPSLREGLPYAALEAIAAGKPVVAFAVGGLPEIVIDNITGFLAAPGDNVRLAEALSEILSDRDLSARLSEGCHRHAQNFTLERHVQRLEEIYTSVARSPRRREASVT